MISHSPGGYSLTFSLSLCLSTAVHGSRDPANSRLRVQELRLAISGKTRAEFSSARGDQGQDEVLHGSGSSSEQPDLRGLIDNAPLRSPSD